jgi:hypothetical protein
MIGKENKPFFFLNNQSFSWEVTIIKETLEIFLSLTAMNNT